MSPKYKEVTMLNLECKVERNQTICDCSLGNELALMNIDTGKYYTINAVGKAIWEKIERPTQIENPLKSLCEEFEVTKEVCVEDVLEYVNSLQNKGLITVLVDAK